MDVRVCSEISALQQVIVHTPGHEVSLVNPELRDELLFDDIIYEEDARREHKDMLALFEAAMPADGKIYEICDLFLESMQQGEARSFLIEQLIKLLPEKNLQSIEQSLYKLEPRELLQFLLNGSTPAIEGFSIDPAPNILFTRDLAAVVNDNLLLSRPSKKARLREGLLMEMLVAYHPIFAEVSDHIIKVGEQESIEGGDVLVASEEVVIIGMSERTSFSGLMKAAEQLLQHNIKHVLAVDIPKQRSSMHLDTIFTYASDNECVIFPPAITERKGNVVELSLEQRHIAARPMESLKSALEELLDRTFTFIPCGGKDRTNQFREQWTDAANVFALSPGIVVGYERNTKTFEVLQDHGYERINQHQFIEEYSNKALAKVDKKLAIGFSGHELCRGRGGARCMTMPIRRAI